VCGSFQSQSSPLYADDPCCNTSIGWTTQNCAERPLTIPLEVYSDITDATEQCYAPRCLSIFAQNFARKSLTVADTLVGCSSNTPNVSAPGLILCPKLTLRRSLLISVLSSTSPIKHAKSPSLACSPIKDSRAGVTRTAKGRLNAISCVTIVSIL
jgi:hypothetical protein